MSVLPVGFGSSGGPDTGDIGHSLRCRSAASTYLSRTSTGTVTAQNIWTFSCFVKRGKLGVAQVVFSGETAGNSGQIYFLADNTLGYAGLDEGVGGVFGSIYTTAVFRDPTAVLHVVVNFDGSRTATDRIRLFVNGVQYTYTISTTVTATQYLNAASSTQVLGNGQYNAPSDYLDGYLSRVCFVDGTALTPSSFGYFNTEINEWVTKSQSAVKTVVDAGGTNSTMLDFDDATSLTTLGYDKSTKGNNWTLNNFSLTAGTTYDHMLDVPGNSFATLNPLQYNPSNIAAGNLQFTSSSSLCARGVPDLRSCGKSYFEYPSAGVNYMGWGVQGGGAVASASMGSVSAELWGVYNTTAMNTIYNGSATSLGVAPPAAGGVLCVAFDAATGNLWLGYAASGTSTPTWIGGGDPAAGTSPSTTVIITKPVFPHADIQGGGGSQTCTFNAGQYPSTANSAFRTNAGGYFHCVPPTDFKALCQANLPDPAILNPKAHFDIKTRTGTAATYSVTGIGFQPDLVWSKSRGRALDHALYDSARGVQKRLESNNTDAEVTGDTTGLTAFNSDGYTGGALDQINGTTATNSFVDWLWRMGGAPTADNVAGAGNVPTAGSVKIDGTNMSTALAGTLAAIRLSANTVAGQSVVTYTGTGANGTVAHGLLRAPELVISKGFGSGGLDWYTYHMAVGTTKSLYLNTTAAATTVSLWYPPTSTVVDLGTAGTNSVLLCFHSVEGYSKIGSYTGNGSTDGPFVHCGFKPRWIMLKRSDSTSDWRIYDTVRQTFNQMDDALEANTSDAEDTASGQLDITATGFKLRDAGANNISSGTYIFIAFAAVAGKYSLGR